MTWPSIRKQVLFPQRSNQTRAKGATHTITGNFDLHGVKKSISFPATIQRRLRLMFQLNAEFSINRKDFGIDYPGKADDLIRDGVVIKLTIKAPREVNVRIILRLNNMLNEAVSPLSRTA